MMYAKLGGNMKYTIIVHQSGASPAMREAKSSGVHYRFDTKAEAQRECDRLNTTVLSPKVRYTVAQAFTRKDVRTKPKPSTAPNHIASKI